MRDTFPQTQNIIFQVNKKTEKPNTNHILLWHVYTTLYTIYSKRRIRLYQKVVREIPSVQRKRFLYSRRELCRFGLICTNNIISSSMVLIYKYTHAGKYIPELAEVIYDKNIDNSSLQIKLKGILVCFFCLLYKPSLVDVYVH